MYTAPTAVRARPHRRTEDCLRQPKQFPEARQGSSAAALAGGPSGRPPAQRWHLLRVQDERHAATLRVAPPAQGAIRLSSFRRRAAVWLRCAAWLSCRRPTRALRAQPRRAVAGPRPRARVRHARMLSSPSPKHPEQCRALGSAPAGAATQPQRAGAQPRLLFWDHTCTAQVAQARQARHSVLARWQSVTARTPDA